MAQELEMKILVDFAEFSRCLSLLQHHTSSAGDRYVQVNYYFDSADFALSSDRSMLRVRRKKDTLCLQYKNKRKRIGSMLLCEENEAELRRFPNTVNPSAYFSDAPDLNCALIGDLVTCRTDFVFPNAVVSLDENIYLGKRDFEIEIEGDEAAIETIAAFLNPVGESKRGNGKFSRFLSEYKKYKQGDSV